jgi:hypothetical protein
MQLYKRQGKEENNARAKTKNYGTKNTHQKVGGGGMGLYSLLHIE